jgi:hypothetical protein
LLIGHTSISSSELSGFPVCIGWHHHGLGVDSRRFTIKAHTGFRKQNLVFLAFCLPIMRGF